MSSAPSVMSHRRSYALGRAVRPISSASPASSFRDVMAHLVAPVSIVTAADDGEPVGTTVSAVMSLSMTPEMLAVGLARESASLTVIRRTRRFAVNILAHDQVDLAMHFARKGADKFATVGHRLESGLPRLDGACGWVRCRVDRIHPAGDHVLVSGLVEASHHDLHRGPLTYFSRTFGTHDPTP